MRLSLPLCTVALVLTSLFSVQAEKVGDVRMRGHMHNARYGEIVLVKGGPFSYVASVYNTLGLNNCPEAAWKALNVDQIKKQFGARSVILNGPRYFVMDWCSVANPGPAVNFGPLEARKLAEVKLDLFSMLRGRAVPYKEIVIDRTTKYIYNKGTTVFELASPDGKRYIMQTYALMVDPNLTIDQLPGLGSRLKLPKGWKYRALKLDKDLVMAVNGKAYLVQDDLENSYQRLN